MDLRDMLQNANAYISKTFTGCWVIPTRPPYNVMHRGECISDIAPFIYDKPYQIKFGSSYDYYIVNEKMREVELGTFDNFVEEIERGTS